MILVTGGTGLLGSHLLYALTGKGYAVRAIYRDASRIEIVRKIFSSYNPTDIEELMNRIEWVKADILDLPLMEEVFTGIETVYHLAAVVSYEQRDFSKMMKINREGTANMVNLALDFGVKKFCHVSSTSTVSINYENRKAPLIESNKWVQTTTTSGYAISKYSAEKEVWRGIEEGLDAVIINPSVIMGAGSWDESSLKIARLADKSFPFYSGGSNAVVDVRDVVECMIQSVEKNLPSDRYLCTGNAVSFRELMNLLADEMGKKRPRWKAGKFLSHLALFFDFIKGIFTGKRTLTSESVRTAASVRAYDSSKIQKALNFEFRPIKETIYFTVKGRIK